MDSSPSIASHTTSYAANFEKLEGSSNFHTWKFSIKNILILEGLWGVIEGQDNDVVRQQRALARICLSVKKELYQYVRNAKSAAAAWNNLSEVFEDRSLYRRVLLLRKLHRVDFTVYSSMNAYIEDVTTLVQQLHDIGRIVEDAEIAEILLSGLPSQYDTLVSGLSTATVTNQVTSELVKARLLQEYSRKTSLEDTAVFVTKKAAPLFCEFCKKKNHRKSQCFKLKRMKKYPRSAGTETTSLASALIAHLPSQVFILDSGASSHMDEDLKSCMPCLEGKMSAASYPRGQATRANQPLELIHSDVCGPMQEPSWGGARYLVTFTDDYSRKTFGYLMKQKSEVMSNFTTFKAYVVKQLGLSIKVLRSDNGGEYINKNFSDYLKREGIVHQSTVPYCPQQNGVSERLNRVLLDKVRCMLSESGLCQRYWGEAVMTAIYLKNRSPTTALAGRMPEEVWTGSKVDLSHLRVFGCIAYCLIPSQKRRKLDAKGKLVIFVGYSECDFYRE
ncbi:uncharacterized protein LOC123661222 [Melitaea cinxia]|uniref:uncharacterized protein LOC123661222 n=1 Tax=Melitaea cinxia TaxID=113334 RepID=UPI001E2730A9|nr:uncharacterized protein LOC123661222 [Melitaea cinxia]